MLRRAIPATGETLPVIGLGTSITHNVSLDDPQMDRLLEVLRVMVGRRCLLIDTAPSYGNAERVVGELVKRQGQRDKVFLPARRPRPDASAAWRRSEASFEALQTDTIDPDPVHNLQDTRTQLGCCASLSRRGGCATSA